MSGKRYFEIPPWHKFNHIRVIKKCRKKTDSTQKYEGRENSVFCGTKSSNMWEVPGFVPKRKKKKRKSGQLFPFIVFCWQKSCPLFCIFSVVFPWLGTIKKNVEYRSATIHCYEKSFGVGKGKVPKFLHKKF